MDWCNLLNNITVGLVTGLVSGGISSWLTTILLKKRWDKDQHKKDFDDDKQTYHRYISRLRNELFLGYKSGDYTYMLRTFEDEPIRRTFTNLSEDSQRVNEEIWISLNSLKTKLENGNAFDESMYKEISGEMFKYSISILKFTEKREKRYTWEH